MRLWRRTSTEVAGAWRSFRYDLGRRPPEPPAGGPDVTSTGMNTFGGQAWDFSSGTLEPRVADRPPEPRRPARRAALVSAFGLLMMLGAAGAYLVVVNGLVAPRDGQPAAARTLPPASPAVTADARFGPYPPSPRRHSSPIATGPAVAGLVVPAHGGPATAAPAKAAPAKAAPAKAAPAKAAPRPEARPVRTVKRTVPGCVCDHPPVPTPTAPGSAPSPTPSAPMPAGSSTSAASSARDTFGTPRESPEPAIGGKAGQHRLSH